MSDEVAVVESPVFEEQKPIGATEPKVAALAMPDKQEVAGFTCHAFTAMRKGFVEMTGNEIRHADDHCKKYLADHGLPESDMQDAEKSWNIMCAAIPDFMFHLTALAYICTADRKTLSGLIGKPQDTFAETVMAWWEDALTEEQWAALTIRAFQELVESNIGLDYKVKDEPGAQPSPNS